MFAYLVHLLFLTYTILLFVRVVGSWFPNFSEHTIMRMVAYYTDPYLNFFRKFIPPLGGMIDLSPIIGFFVLQILENVIMRILR